MPNTAPTMTMPGATMPGLANSSAPILRPSRMASSRVFPAISCASILEFSLAQSRHAAGGGIFEMQRLAREDQRAGGMRGERRLGKAGQYELQLSRVSRDIADGENSRHARGAARRLDADMAALEIETPFGNGPEIHRQAKEGQQHVGCEPPALAFQAVDQHGGEGGTLAFEPGELEGYDQLDRTLRRERFEAGGAFRRGAEFRPAMHDHDLLGDIGQSQRPIDRRIAAAGDHHALVAEILAPLDVVMDALAFEALDAGERRPVRSEGA